MTASHQFPTRRKLPYTPTLLLYFLLLALLCQRSAPWILQLPLEKPSAVRHAAFRRSFITTTLLHSSLGSNYLQSVEQQGHASAHNEEDDDSTSAPKKTTNVLLHHTCLKTRNITTAIQFYSLFGYQLEGTFRAGPARAAWLELDGSQHRLELIEIPLHVLNERLGQKRRAMDLMERQDLLGYNHVALDVTNQIVGNQTLAIWIDELSKVSLERFGKSLRLALEPKQQMIGSAVFELAFLYDADGCLVELLRYQADLPQDVNSGWEPWDGEGFVGPSDYDNDPGE